MSHESPATLAAPRLRPHDAARYLALAEQTLAKMRCEGGGPKYAKLGRAVVYDVRDLDAWIEERGKRTSTVSPATGPAHAA